MAKSEQLSADESGSGGKRRDLRGPYFLVLGALVAAGAFVGYKHGEEGAAALSFSRSSINLDNTYNMQGVAIGNRWKTRFAFSEGMQDILSQNVGEYSAWPSDNEFFDIKTREAKRPEFTNSSTLIEVGKVHLRLERIVSHENPVPDKSFEVKTS
jgi:hypothetical protein